jgi:hypothetical protein
MTSAVSGLSAALFRDEPEEYVVTANLGSNRDICFASKNGTDASVEIIVSGNNTPLSISDSGTKITINSATNSGGVATSTAAQIVAAFNADAEAAALFTARLPPGSTGTGVTGAMSETTAADGVAETGLACTDSGDGRTFQAAAGSRYWDDGEALTVYIDGAKATSGFTVNYLQGKVTFDSDQTGKTITVDCVRRSLLAFQKVFGMFEGKLKISGKEIDTSSVDDDGWGSSLIGSRSWELTAGTFFYDGGIPITAIAVKYLWKFYSVLATVPLCIGWGAITSIDNMTANPNEAQKQTITVKGAGELFME